MSGIRKRPRAPGLTQEQLEQFLFDWLLGKSAADQRDSPEVWGLWRENREVILHAYIERFRKKGWPGRRPYYFWEELGVSFEEQRKRGYEILRERGLLEDWELATGGKPIPRKILGE